MREPWDITELMEAGKDDPDFIAFDEWLEKTYQAVEDKEECDG